MSVADRNPAPTRRAVLSTAAWAAPVVAFTLAAPAAAASETPPPADYTAYFDVIDTGYSIDVTVTPAGRFPLGGHLSFEVPRSRFLLSPVDYGTSPWKNYSASLSTAHTAWAIRDVVEPRVLRLQFPDDEWDLQDAGYAVWSETQQLLYSGSLAT